MGVVGQRRQGDLTVQLVGADELALARVPGGEDLGGRRAAEDARMDEAGELDVGDVARGAVDALKVPDCLCAGG
jgi:hypothetical protein